MLPTLSFFLFFLFSSLFTIPLSICSYSFVILLCSFHNSFKGGFNPSINALATRALRNVSQYFPNEHVRVLGELASLVARMYDEVSEERGMMEERVARGVDEDECLQIANLLFLYSFYLQEELYWISLSLYSLPMTCWRRVQRSNTVKISADFKL